MVTLKKIDFYYVSKGNDALVLMALTGIKIRHNNECAFNSEFLEQVIKILCKFNIAYSIIKDDDIVMSGEGKQQNYDLFLSVGLSIRKLYNYMNEESIRIKHILRTINTV